MPKRREPGAHLGDREPGTNLGKSETNPSVLQHRSTSHRTSEPLRAVCEANGLSQDDFILGAQHVTHLDLFMGREPDLSCMAEFPNLDSLCIMKQDGMRTLRGLAAPLLDRLWVTECGLESGEGVKRCASLTKLDLSANCITSADGITGLAHLQTLWINDNRLTSLEGIGELLHLRELWACGNRITAIGASLSKCDHLESLHLAGNAISSFRDLLHLQSLQTLQHLALSDPHFGDNPVCRLCNYQTYVIYHLSHLDILDSEGISDESKQLAMAIFLKKKMYYNMRSKTIKRDATNVLDKAKSMMLRSRRRCTDSLHAVLRASKDVIAVSAAAAEGGEEGEAADEKFPEARTGSAEPGERAGEGDERSDEHPDADEWLARLDRARTFLEGRLFRAAKLFYDFQEQVAGISHFSVDRVMLEFETGGNIRLEDGQSTDLWCSSCKELVQARLGLLPPQTIPNSPTSANPLSVGSVQVNRVVRIHNRMQRYAFERRVQSMAGEMKPASGERLLEYLIFCEPWDPKAGERSGNPARRILSLAEGGFAPLGTPVRLYSTLNLADKARIADRAAHPRAGRGYLLLVKAFVGNAREVGSTAEAESLKEHGGPDCYVQHGVSGAGGGGKEWYFSDMSLLLPEYIVAYKYCREEEEVPTTEQLKADIQESGGIGGHRSLADQELVDYGPFLVPLFQFRREIDLPTNLEEKTRRLCGGIQDLSKNVQGSSLTTVTEQSLLAYTNATTLADITELNLHAQSIKRVEPLTQCHALRSLTLSCNQIDRFEGLCKLAHLETLDLSFNSIARVSKGGVFPRLEELDLSFNLIDSACNLDGLACQTPHLRSLDLRGNDLDFDGSARLAVLRFVSDLFILSGEDITDSDREALSLAPTSLTITHIAESRTGTDPSLPPEEGDEPAVEAWMSGHRELCVNDKVISSAPILTMAVRLRVLSLAHNQLTSLQDLTACVMMEELCVEHNHLSSLEGIEALTRLKRMDVSHNRLSQLDQVHSLTDLIQVSAERNQVTSLAPLCNLQQLMEIYLGNNSIWRVEELDHLRTMPKLIILDLAGCQVCTEPEYRPLALFRGRRLKVLDGASVTLDEANAAVEKFSGRLTKDDLVKALAAREDDGQSGTSIPMDLAVLASLKLVKVGLKDVSILSTLSLDALKDLNLEHNSLGSFASLLLIPNLRILRLGNNRIEGCMEQRGKTRDTPTNLPQSDLEVLLLGSNRISRVDDLCLARMPSLRVLHLQSNQLTSVAGVAVASNLRELVLNKNRIRQFDPSWLGGLGLLQELHVEHTGLRGLGGLAVLRSLQSLHAGHNRVSEIAELEELQELEHILSVAFNNNPVSRKQLYRPTLLSQFPRLRWIDGKEAPAEEKERAEVILRSEKPLKFFLQEMRPGVLPPSHQPGDGTLVPKKPSGAAAVAAFRNITTGNISNPHFLPATSQMEPPFDLRRGGRPAVPNSGTPEILNPPPARHLSRAMPPANLTGTPRRGGGHRSVGVNRYERAFIEAP